jgi:ABC-2 type transport system permease protein
MTIPPALALASAELRRVARDRTFLFFLVVLPVLVILLVGLTTAGSTTIRIAVVPGPSTPLAAQLVRDLEVSPALKTQRFATREQGVDALRRGEVEAVVVIPTTLDAELRAGGTTKVPVLVSGDVQSSQAAVTAVSSVVARNAATVQAANLRHHPLPAQLRAEPERHQITAEPDSRRRRSARRSSTARAAPCRWATATARPPC